MATHDYIPGDEAGRIAWLLHFAGWMTTYGAAHGFTSDEISTLNTDVDDADTAVTNTVEKEADFRAAVVTKQDNIANAIHLAREDVRRLQADPNMTDAERAAAGITVPDATKTPRHPRPSTRSSPRCSSSISAYATKSPSTGAPTPATNTKTQNPTASWAAKSNTPKAASQPKKPHGSASAWTPTPPSNTT